MTVCNIREFINLACMINFKMKKNNKSAFHVGQQSLTLHVIPLVPQTHQHCYFVGITFCVSILCTLRLRKEVIEYSDMASRKLKLELKK